MEKPEAAPAPRIDRRTFFANLVLGIAGALSLGILGERLFAFLSPPAPPQKEIEFAVAELEAIPDGGGTVIHLPAGSVALERKGAEVSAYSAVCTHLGCVVQWQPTKTAAWYCPCHGGRYDHAGRPVAGPPPRALKPVPVAVRDGQVYVRLIVRAPEGLV